MHLTTADNPRLQRIQGCVDFNMLKLFSIIQGYYVFPAMVAHENWNQLTCVTIILQCRYIYYMFYCFNFYG